MDVNATNTEHLSRQNNLRGLNIIIVDDEEEARKNLKNIFTNYIGAPVNIVGMANNTADAEKQIIQHKPDAVFLDIEMPGENAFHFLKRIAPFNFEVVFVTAYDEYAIKAFRLNAVDYILKPISIAELGNAVKKLRDKIIYKSLIGHPENYDTHLLKQANREAIHKITLKDNSRIEIVDFKDILHVEAKGSYSGVVFLKNNELKTMFMSHSISEYEEILPREMFYRVHKSYLVNRLHVNKLVKEETNVFVNVAAKFTLPVSRRRYNEFVSFLKNDEPA